MAPFLQRYLPPRFDSLGLPLDRLVRLGGSPGPLLELRLQRLIMRTYVMSNSIPQLVLLMRSNGLPRDLCCSASHLRSRLARVGPTTPTRAGRLARTR